MNAPDWNSCWRLMKRPNLTEQSGSESMNVVPQNHGPCAPRRAVALRHSNAFCSKAARHKGTVDLFLDTLTSVESVTSRLPLTLQGLRAITERP